MEKSIITVGIEVPGANTKYKSLDSNVSLLDYDISIFDPDITSLFGYSYEEYLGKPALDDSSSFKLKENLAHWRREILGAMKAGKTVFLLLNKLEEVYVASGTKTYSGTGRNRQEIRDVYIHNNYSLVPGDLHVVNTRGKSMRLHGSENILSTYWSELGDICEYRVLISGKGIKPLINTRTGDKIVGSHVHYKNVAGSLVLLPYINFQKDEFTEISGDDDKLYWTEKAVQIGKQFFSAIVGVDKAVRASSELSIAPDWVNSEEYLLPGEGQIQKELLNIETNLEALQEEKEIKQQSLSQETILKRLLYETGKPLEDVSHNALTLMGFKVSHFKDAESEFDVLFECAEGRLIGEAEGKDNKPINIEKLRQLNMNINEDFARDEVDAMAKGALIGNAYRLSKPKERKEFFTAKCLTAANLSKTALIRSTDLFIVAKYLSGKNNKIFAKNCRQALLESIGVVKFPEPPDKESKIKDNVKVDDKS